MKDAREDVSALLLATQLNQALTTSETKLKSKEENTSSSAGLNQVE